VTTGADFKPSQVYLGIPPLTATMGHAEAEFAAALVVRTLAVKGDTWRAVGWREIEEVVTADMKGKVEPIGLLMCNPFFQPDIHDTVKRGFARWTDKPNGTVELTEEGIAALAKWVPKLPDTEAVAPPAKGPTP
jgi:hypothetical protein